MVAGWKVDIWPMYVFRRRAVAEDATLQNDVRFLRLVIQLISVSPFRVLYICIVNKALYIQPTEMTVTF